MDIILPWRQRKATSGTYGVASRDESTSNKIAEGKERSVLDKMSGLSDDKASESQGTLDYLALLESVGGHVGGSEISLVIKGSQWYNSYSR